MKSVIYFLINGLFLVTNGSFPLLVLYFLNLYASLFKNATELVYQDIDQWNNSTELSHVNTSLQRFHNFFIQKVTF